MKNHHETLTLIILSVIPKINSISSEEIRYKPVPNKWSKVEILGHLIDSAYNNHQRFLRAESQGNLIFQGYDQDDWVIKNNYQNRNEKEILETWVGVNRHISILTQGLSEELLNKKTTEHNFHKICMNVLEEGETTTLSYLIWDYNFHIEHHLSQIISDYKRVVRAFGK